LGVKELMDEQVSVLETPVVLLSMSPVIYQQSVLDTVRYFSDRFGDGLYVTLNKPTATLRKNLEKGGVSMEKIFFLDSITSTAAEVTESCYYLGKMQELSELCLAISKLVSERKDIKFLLLDSVSTLLIYNDSKSVTRFCHLVTEKLRRWGLSGAFVSVEMGEGADMVAQLAQFCDAYVKPVS
jgi:KaiC/GvpD/RAD55 family RecA-like ATPase